MLGIAGMLLPIYGSALDPGYAESLPGHSHVMFDGASLAAHRASEAASSDDGVLAMPNASDAGALSVVVAAAAFALLAFGGLPANRFPRRPLALRIALAPTSWSDSPVIPPPKPLVAAQGVR